MRTEQIERFYQSIAHCGDPGLRLPQRLTEAGFAAFAPRDAFIASFCNNDEEREIHQHYTTQVAKMRLSRQQPTQWWDHRTHYRSQLIEDLKRRRDAANGCDGNEVRTRFPGEPWRRELDPCHANMMAARSKDGATYGPRWKSVLDDEARLLASESSRHATGLSRDFAFDADGRHAFLQRALERDTHPLGFALDRTKSTLGFSVFSKSILPDLDLCWTLEDVEGLVSGYAEGRYRPSLELRRSKVRGRLNKAAKIDPVNLLVIDFVAAIPNLGAAYWLFRNLDQLETSVRAHLCLYGFLAPLIEDAARDAFA